MDLTAFKKNFVIEILDISYWIPKLLDQTSKSNAGKGQSHIFCWISQIKNIVYTHVGSNILFQNSWSVPFIIYLGYISSRWRWRWEWWEWWEWWYRRQDGAKTRHRLQYRGRAPAGGVEGSFKKS